MNLLIKRMTLQKLINLLNKTHDFIEIMHLLNKTHDFIKMINLLSETHDFIKMINLLIKMERCNFWKKILPLVCSKYLFSWTGLGRSGHDQITTGHGQIIFLVQFRMFRVQKLYFDEIYR